MGTPPRDDSPKGESVGIGMKRLLKESVIGAMRFAQRAGVLDALERLDGERHDVLRVLTYHRVAEPVDADLFPGLISATPSGFARQMEYLRAHWHVVSLPEVLDAYRTRSPLPHRAVLITFDDGYVDFEQHAWPVLAGMGLSATLFVPTAYPDCPGRAFWWDRLFEAVVRGEGALRVETSIGALSLASDAEGRKAFGRLRSAVKTLPHRRATALVDEVCRGLGVTSHRNPVLGWDSLRSLARAGVSICAHTRSHPQLDCLPEDDAREEIVSSLGDVRREIGDLLPVFAYPDGRFDSSTVRILGEEGVELAFTTRRGINRVTSAHPLRLRRIPVWPRSSEPILRAQMLGWMAKLDRSAFSNEGRGPAAIAQ